MKFEQIKQIFNENIKNKKFSNLSSNCDNFVDKSNTKIDLTDLISCSEDYFEDMLKIYEAEEKVLEINENKYLKLCGTGILYLIVNKDSNLFLDVKIENENFESLFIKILVKENVKFNLIGFNQGKNLFTNIKIIANDNSKINHLMFNYNNFFNSNEVKLNENVVYELQGINYSQNENLINYNEAFHINDNSKSDFKINCYSFENSKIECKTKTKTERNIKQIEGHQKSAGLILSKTSKISCEPILEILSKDVISSHSASVSKIFDDVKYYLMSRGMSDKEIKDFIVNQRYEYLIEKIEVEEFKNILNEKFKNE